MSGDWGRVMAWVACLLLPIMQANAAGPTPEWDAHTPHWNWVSPSDGTRPRVVFILNYLGSRECQELSQRFGFDGWVVPTAGDAYRNQFDEAALIARLDQPVDLIVIAATAPQNDLSIRAQSALRRCADAGVPVVIFSRSTDLTKQWNLWADLKIAQHWKDVLCATLPPGAASVQGAGNVTVYQSDRARVILATGYDLSRIWFGAFQPEALLEESNPWAMELGYAIAGWIAKSAITGQPLPQVTWTLPSMRVAQRASLLFSLANSAAAGDHLEWWVHDSTGDLLARGVELLDAGTRRGNVEFTVPAGGDQLLRWSWRRSTSTVAFGALRWSADSPQKWTELSIPACANKTGGVDLAWRIAGDESQTDSVVDVQVIDPDARVISRTQAPVSAGRATLSPWPARYSTYQVRVLLRQGQWIMDQRRFWITKSLPREQDTSDFHTILWASESGQPVERHRYDLMRQLGITTLATIGQRIASVQAASQHGLRVLPTNVLVPPIAQKSKSYDQGQQVNALRELVRQSGLYSPLAYSLSDEPAEGTDLIQWRSAAAQVIHEHDPGSKIGYCGVRLKNNLDIPGFFAACDLAELYSPHHLYTPDLWMGTERDLMRSMVRPDALLTCWTHYVTTRDHEAYARTVPWLWLFEGMNGVSYFASAFDAFTVLEPDLRPGRDMRWVAQELSELRRGIARQIIAARRVSGNVRILFVRGSCDTEAWARAMNRMGVPYCYTTPQAAAETPESTLVICPSVTVLSENDAACLRKIVARGGTLLAVSPLGVFDEQAHRAAPDRFSDLFGFHRTDAPNDQNSADKTFLAHSRAPVKARLDLGPWKSSPVEVSGSTSGEYSLACEPDTQWLGFARVGEVSRQSEMTKPATIEALERTPAMLIKQHGPGAAVLLTFLPTPESVAAMLPALLRQVGAQQPVAQVLRDGKVIDTVFPYHLIDSRIELLGLVPDYIRIPPAAQTEPLKTAAYIEHGQFLWEPFHATVQLNRSTHLYDVRASEYLGHVSNTDLQLQPGLPALLALLPYQVNSLELAASKEIQAGHSLEVIAKLRVSNPPAGDHFCEVTLTPPKDVDFPVDQQTVRMTKGHLSSSTFVPYNAPAGVWRLAVRDAVTGITATQDLRVTPGPELFRPPSMDKRPRWIASTQVLPSGQWTPLVNGKLPAGPEAVTVSVEPLQRKPARIFGNHQNHQYLTGGFSLGNGSINYHMKYLVCNDHEAHAWPDPRQIDAPYTPGLGIDQPRPHLWFYNGYMNVYFDGVCATAFRLEELSKVERSDGVGQVDAVWNSPLGKIQLSSAMIPGQPGMFQRLTVTPAKPVRETKVRFFSFPQGFDGTGKRFTHIDAEDKCWIVLGDSANDRAFFERGLGPGALLVEPSQWTKADLDNLTLSKIDDTTPSPASPPSMTFQWVLWLFPNSSNANAIDYLRLHSLNVRKRMDSVLPMLDVKP